MTVAVVQAASGTAVPLSFTSSVTAGNTVIVISADVIGGTPTLASPTLGGSAVTGAFAVFNDSGSNGIVQVDTALSVWILPNCAAANGVNFGTNTSVFNWGIAMFEVSGLGSTPTVDVTARDGSTGAAISSGASPNTSQSPDVVVGGAFANNSITGSPSGWTVSSPSGFFSAGYQVATTSGNSFTWTQTTSPAANWGATVVAVSQLPATPPASYVQFFHLF